MMHRFVIDEYIEQIASNYRGTMLSTVPAIANLESLRGKLSDGSYQLVDKDDNVIPNDSYVDYLNTIKQDYNLLLTVHPKGFKQLKDKYDNILSEAQLKTKIRCKNDKGKTHYIEFYELIVKAMNYNKVQSTIFPPIMRDQLEIKTCVYCNSQYAATTKGSRAMYELDHCVPKSVAPYLSTSFFNLQPCCGPCNRRKSNRLFVEGAGWEYNLSIWKEPDDQLGDLFKFKLDKTSLTQYATMHDKSALLVQLVTSKHNDANSKKLLKEVDDKLCINALYQCFNDVVEEIAWRKLCYTPGYIEGLKKEFKNNFPDMGTEWVRLVYGSYTNSDDIYKRPLTKMIQDVSLQL